MLEPILSIVSKIGLKGGIMVGLAATSGYFWYELDKEKNKVVSLQTDIGKQQVLIDTANAAIVQLEEDNTRKDKLHDEASKLSLEETDQLNEKLKSLKKQNKFLFSKLIDKPVQTGDAINARHYQWMCRIYYREDCPSASISREDVVPPTDSEASKTNKSSDNNSNSSDF